MKISAGYIPASCVIGAVVLMSCNTVTPDGQKQSGSGQFDMQGPGTMIAPGDSLVIGIDSGTDTVFRKSGASVTVPEGAVSKTTEVVIKQFSNPPPFTEITDDNASDPWAVGIGVPFDFGPEGLTFEKPVTLTIPWNEQNLESTGAGEDELQLAYYNGQHWVTLEAGKDTVANEFTLEVIEFPGIAFMPIVAAAICGPVIVYSYSTAAERIYAWYEKDPVYNKDAHTYITPDDPEVKTRSQNLLAQTGTNTYQPIAKAGDLESVIAAQNDINLVFEIGEKYKQRPDYQISEEWGNDWIKPSEYFANGMKGDCKNIANAYCSVLRALDIDARCVDGFMDGGRHVWIEVEVDKKAYYIGNNGEITALSDAVSKLKLTRRINENEGYMWTEDGQVRYQDNWWKKVDFSTVYKAYVEVNIKGLYRDGNGSGRTWENTLFSSPSTDRMGQYIDFASSDKNTWTGEWTDPIDSDSGRIELTVSSDNPPVLTRFYLSRRKTVASTYVERHMVEGENIPFSRNTSKSIEFHVEGNTVPDYLVKVEGEKLISDLHYKLYDYELRTDGENEILVRLYKKP